MVIIIVAIARKKKINHFCLIQYGIIPKTLGNALESRPSIPERVLLYYT